MAHAKSRLEGVYESYRYSRRLLGKKIILRGLTEFWVDDQKQTIRAREIYRIQRAKGISSADLSFVREGYLINDRYSGLIKVFSHKNDESGEFQITYLPDVISRGGIGSDAKKANEISGFLVDWQGNSPYVAPIFLRRHEKGYTARSGMGSEFPMAFKETDPQMAEYIDLLKQNFAIPCYEPQAKQASLKPEG